MTDRHLGTAPARRFRVVATDLDGTLFPASQPDEVEPVFSSRVADAIARVRARGAHVIAVTARSPRSAAPLARRLGLSALAICGSGSILYDLDRDEISASSAIDPATGSEIVLALRRELPGAMFAAEQGLSFAREPAYPVSAFTPYPHHEGDALTFFERAPTTKLVVREPSTAARALWEVVRTVVGERLATETTGPPWVGMLHPRATKGHALSYACAQMGIGAHEVVAFGDHLPDVGMLRWAGLGVAVANAAPEVLEAADMVAPSSEEDGVASVLEEMLATDRI